jgi:N-methylhydantoinase A/oxoprolinase/acetone carboxylase beta subunit
MGMHWVGVDVGGTFTDVVVYDEGTGGREVAKAPTSTADPTVGLLNEGQIALDAPGRPILGALPSDTAELRHLAMPPIPGGLVSG